MNGLAEVEPRRIYRLEKSNSHWNANYKKASVKDADGDVDYEYVDLIPWSDL